MDNNPPVSVGNNAVVFYIVTDSGYRNRAVLLSDPFGIQPLGKEAVIIQVFACIGYIFVVILIYIAAVPDYVDPALTVAFHIKIIDIAFNERGRRNTVFRPQVMAFRIQLLYHDLYVSMINGIVVIVQPPQEEIVFPGGIGIPDDPRISLVVR